MPKLAAILITVYCLLSTAVPAFASTDPQLATVSATATVPPTTSTTSDTTAPPAVALISPPDATITNQTTPEFVWVQTFDGNSNTLHYTLLLNEVTIYLGISNIGNSQQYNYISRLDDGRIYLRPSQPLPEGDYSWQVNAVDGSGNTSHSATWRFRIDTTAPPLILTNIDDVYTTPSLLDGSNFDLAGPQDVTLSFVTEPYATVTLTYTLPNSIVTTLLLPSEGSGIVNTSLPLPLGTIFLNVSSFDRAGLTTALPQFSLTLVTTPYAALLPALTPQAPIPSLALPPAIQSFGASILSVSPRFNPAFYIFILLAISIFTLLIFIWKRRPNILIIDTKTNQLYRSIILYHSTPTHSAHFASLGSRLLVTRHAPLLYRLSPAKAYIPHLRRYSTLTIRTPDNMTYVLSLSSHQKSYVLYI